MKRFWYFSALWMALPLLVLLQSCSKGINASPTAPIIPAANPMSLLSAYATIGTSTDFEIPAVIRYSNGHLWLANVSTFLQEWAVGGSAPVTDIWTYGSSGTFSLLFGVSIDPATGNVYACDEINDQIVVFDPSGNYLAVFGSAQMAVITASNPYGFSPCGVAVNSSGTTVYALGSNTVYTYSIGGTALNPNFTYRFPFGNTGPSPTTLNLSALGVMGASLSVDKGGNVWVADPGNHRLAEYSASGSYLRSFKVNDVDSNFTPVDDLVDGTGNVYGADSIGGVIVKFNSSGGVVGQFGQGILTSPQGITTDGQGNFYVSNFNPPQIVVFH